VTQTVFGTDYSAAYDALYQDKDYGAECDLLERVFAQYGRGPVRRVLDLGCGTGGHAVRLAQRGYTVVGVDRSPDMLRQAIARESGARFVRGNLVDLHLEETFEAVLMMFAVLGYQVTNTEVQAALATARRHLEPGGVLFFDVWYGPAVLAQRPAERMRVIDTAESGQIIRLASSELDARHDLCTVRYRLWRIAENHVEAEVHEQHPMRYFFEPELELLLTGAGFELAHVGSFPQLEEQPSESSWNVAIVARAR
jgi:SAM-dependent methyltransferase